MHERPSKPECVSRCRYKSDDAAATTTPKANSTNWWASLLTPAPRCLFLQSVYHQKLLSSVYTRPVSFYMNMIGHPKHVPKCLALGVDLICAQGGESGGHTGDVPTSVLIPTVKAMCEGKTSPMSGQPVQVVAAGGIFNGQSLASAMALGATAVWVGTRFVLSEVSFRRHVGISKQMC